MKKDRQTLRGKGKPAPNGPIWIYGRHAASAALTNPGRMVRRVVATRNAAKWLEQQGLDVTAEDLKPDAIDKLLSPGAVHQGLAVQVDDLPRQRLKDVCKIIPGDRRAVVILDQITDPQNIGAILRTAAAFNAKAVIVQDRKTPPLAGALTKAAAGAAELVPFVRVVNIARSLEALQEIGYQCVGLAGEAPTELQYVPRDKPIALVMGAEGSGLRQLVSETCNSLARIPISSTMESLNVSNAAAISLYELSRDHISTID